MSQTPWSRQFKSCSSCKQAGGPEDRPSSADGVIYSWPKAQPEKKPKSLLLQEGQHVLHHSASWPGLPWMPLRSHPQPAQIIPLGRSRKLATYGCRAASGQIRTVEMCLLNLESISVICIQTPFLCCFSRPGLCSYTEDSRQQHLPVCSVWTQAPETPGKS